MDKFWSLALLFFLIWCITTDIIYIIIRFIKLIACRNKGDCKNRKCLVNETCMKYNKSLTQAKDAGWTEKRALEFLSMIRCPDFWDIQLNLFEKAIIQD